MAATSTALRVVVAGCRHYTNATMIYHELTQLQKDLVAGGLSIACIVHGGCRGVDTIADRWAEVRKVPTIVYPADWETYGKKAGPMRNAKMIAEADVLIAFWDRKSKGTGNIIGLAGDRVATKIVDIEYVPT